MQGAADAKSFVRIKELALNPTQGQFDLAHLLSLHRYIFQDLPEYAPGELRPATRINTKLRVLEGSGQRYKVPYACNLGEDGQNTLPETVAEALARLPTVDALRAMSPAEFTDTIAEVYTQLDYLHPFQEGNSRTLRAFTQELSDRCGHKLSWQAGEVDAKVRDRLYIARDQGVILKRFPGLNFDQACKTPYREEQEAWLQFLSKFKAHPALAEVMATDNMDQQNLLEPAGEERTKDVQRIIGALQKSGSTEMRYRAH